MNSFDTNTLRRCFNRAALTYDENCKVQSRAGEKLIRLLKKHKPLERNLIDLGCGTGFITERLIEKFNFNRFYAIDIADALLAIAKIRLKDTQVEIFEKDFHDFNFKKKQFDCIFSNMSFQWSYDLKKLLNNIFNNLNDEGLVSFSVPLKGTFLELDFCASNVFLSPKEWISFLRESHFKLVEYVEESFTVHFPTCIDALRSIKAVGANCVIKRAGHRLLSKKMKEETHPFSLTYKIGFFIAKKI